MLNISISLIIQIQINAIIAISMSVKVGILAIKIVQIQQLIDFNFKVINIQFQKKKYTETKNFIILIFFSPLGEFMQNKVLRRS